MFVRKIVTALRNYDWEQFLGDLALTGSALLAELGDGNLCATLDDALVRARSLIATPAP